jgi:hypothetical protein
VQPDQLQRVTPSLLRSAGKVCPRRLARELDSDSRSSSPVHRARLREPFLEAARTAHAELRPPGLEWFAPPTHLEPEEQEVFRHAARWYVRLYGARPVRTHLHDLDHPSESPARRLRIGGWVDLTVVGGDGSKELRQVDLWGGRAYEDPLDDVSCRLAVLRLSRWVADGKLLVSRADLVRGQLAERTIDPATLVPELRDWFDSAVAAVRDRADHDVVEPGRDCATCAHVAGCPAHPTGAHGISARGDVRPGIIHLSPTTLERWHHCRREWLSRLLSVPASDESGFPDHGDLVHSLLRLVHMNGSCRDRRHVGRALEAHALAGDVLVRDELDRHVRRCPDPSDAIGHELEVARFHRTPVPLFMATARLDAVWAHDGLLDARDYKTGGKRTDRVAEDRRGRLQAWVLAPLAAQRGLRLRLSYEQLSPDVDDDPEPFEPEEEDLAQIEEELHALTVEIRAEQEFAGVAEPDACNRCQYRSICPDSAAAGEPSWPAPPDEPEA